ncbi:MAG: hypothetical protein P4L93_02320 [Coriobacteriia bacterium]|nr:hypothetical protein [Coriobacteriia bacterium]
MSPLPEDAHETAHYRALGLLANPFLAPAMDGTFDGRDYEMTAAANALLGEIVAAAAQEKAKPIVVNKTADVPSSYSLRSIGFVEHAIVADDSLDVLHAYVPLFLMRVGRVRATLRVVAERLSFREFDKTLACYVERVLAEPDESLIAYQVIGEERLAAFADTFRADPLATIDSLFGDPNTVERRPELTEVGDARGANLEANVDDEESTPEIDSTVGDAPGTDIVLGEEADARDEDNLDQEVMDYLVEYTKVHLSPVVARALRVYRERGLAALTSEFSITKAPRKTLAAVIKFARTRFDKIVLIYDGFDGWGQVPPDTRMQIASTLSEIRWALESDAVLVMMLQKGEVSELEEQFGAGTQLEWSFPGVIALQDAPDELDATTVNRWLDAAAYPGSEPITLDDRVLRALADASHDSLRLFVTKAAAAVESAAEHGASALDDEALEAGIAAEWSEEATE